MSGWAPAALGAPAQVDREELLGLQGPPWAAPQGSGVLLLSESLWIGPGKDQGWSLMELSRHLLGAWGGVRSCWSDGGCRGLL